MNVFDTFTKKQKETYAKVLSLEEELAQTIDPTTFVLNPEVIRIQDAIETEREKCQHIYENGRCVVCGKEESNK